MQIHTLHPGVSCNAYLIFGCFIMYVCVCMCISCAYSVHIFRGVHICMYCDVCVSICMYMYVSNNSQRCILCISECILSTWMRNTGIHTDTYNTDRYIDMHYGVLICARYAQCIFVCISLKNTHNTYMQFTIHTDMHMQDHW